MPDLAWLTARPIAHRGLHDAAAGVIENTGSAFAAAIAGGFAIETDLQISADGEAMVHHDDALGRLTEGSEALARMSAAAIQAVRFKATADRILTLAALCELVAGRVPMVIELKSRFDGDMRLAVRAAEVLAGYAGPAALMSFDPAPIARIRQIAPHLPRGIVAERHYTHHEWDRLSAFEKFSLAFLLHAPQSRPQFLAYSVKDLPAAVPLVARRAFGLPLLTWTVRSESDRARAARYADQMIFEGFRPS
ncbi:MAG: glycerophosphodiester phosphodiesterase family protein [Pseudolabrys sp.]|nr:glycerophosphodiester phosphodiesterase family protein [Pseudolabrys sp.]MDP2294791.1 glycerophosphodiester phosphodiesterase family protein [Pseudolabrys sp.]